MRRRPEEHHQEEHEGRPGQTAGHRGPPDEDGHASGDAAPHHVLCGTPLEQQGVDEDVEKDRKGRQRRREQVHRQGEPDGRPDGQHQAVDQGSARGDQFHGTRTFPGAAHLTVDVSVEVTVDRVGAGRRHRAEQQGGDRGPQRRHTPGGDEHHRDGGDEQQLDDTELGKGHVGADVLAQGGLAGGLGPLGVGVVRVRGSACQSHLLRPHGRTAAPRSRSHGGHRIGFRHADTSTTLGISTLLATRGRTDRRSVWIGENPVNDIL